MKRIISILLTAILIFSLVPLSAFAADTYTSPEDFTFTVDEDNKTIILSEYKGSSDSVTVAAEYEIDGQSYTTVLDSMTVFIKNVSIKSVKICDGVTFLNNSMKALFRECTSLNSVDLTGVDTSEISDFSYMFYKCGNIKSLDVTGFVTENAATIRSMFYYCSALTSITGLDTWNTSNVTEMNFVFYYCSSLKTLDLSAFTTGNATTFRSLFCYCSALTAINGVENFNTSNITDFSYMFYGCSSLKTIDVSNYDTSNSEAFRAFVYNCTSLTSITGLDNLNTEKATDLSFMFYNCTGIKTLDLSSFDTSSVTSIRGIFSGCNHLSTITGLSDWNTSSLEDMSYAFNNVANALSASTQVIIDMSRWDLDQIKTNGWCFQNCKAQQIIVPDNLGVISAGFMNHAVRYAGSTYTVPAGVKKIGYAHTFYDFATNDFTEFIVAEGNTNYKTVDGILYSADGKEMLAVPRNKPFENGVFEIPDGVEFFGELSFSRNYNIHTVVLPDTYKIKYVPLYDDRYIVYDDTGNLNAGSNLSIAIYCYTGITDYEVKPTNPNYSSVDGIVYSKDLTHVAAIPARYSKVMNIPEGVKVWDSDAMWADGSSTVDNLLANCSGVILPSTLTSIDGLQLDMLNRIHTNRSSGSNPFTITLSGDNTSFYLDENGNLLHREELHNFIYNYDASQHWQECSDCNYKGEKQNHTFDYNGICSTCGYESEEKADYTEVDKALDDIPEDLTVYTDESVSLLETAVDSVIRNLYVGRQSDVDKMAENINRAISSLKLKEYTITFINGDEVLQVSSVEHGAMPAYTGAFPVKQADSDNHYTFSGWSPSIGKAAADTEYTAQFASEPHIFDSFGICECGYGLSKYTVTVPNDCTVTYKKADNSAPYCLATITAPKKSSSGDFFTYWIDCNGEIVSTYRTYTFYNVREEQFTPVYTNPSVYQTERQKALFAGRMIDVKKDADDSITVIAEHSVSTTEDLRGHGIIMTGNPEYSTEEYLNAFAESDDIYKFNAVKSANSLTGILEIKAKIPCDTIWSRPYIIDGSGEYHYGKIKRFDISNSSSDSVDEIIMTDIVTYNSVQKTGQDDMMTNDNPDKNEIITDIISMILNAILKLKAAIRSIMFI